MRTSGYIFKLLLIIVLFGCQVEQQKKKSESKPNIIFLMDDQHRWDALGVVNGMTITPTLDKLANEGIRFDQAVCQAPMCIASRNSMMLGLYPNQIGILRNEPGLPDSLLPMKPLPQVFLEAGYETAGFGKTHWGLYCSTRGFETRYTGEIPEIGSKTMKDIDPEKKARYDLETEPFGAGEERPSGYIGKTSDLPENEHRDGWVFEKCLEYLEAREDERPLFLYLSFLKPHAGHNVPAGYEERYDLNKIVYASQPDWEEDYSPHALKINRRDMYEGFWKNASESQWKEMTMRYWANCSWIDDMFGRTLNVLDKKGLLENALIVYLSDHGEMLGERYYRFNKYCLYESSVRVPIILSGSALSEKIFGKVDRSPVELVDIYPTLLTATGIEVPDKSVGIDLLDLEAKRSASFCALHERPGEAAFMWRNADFKLILMFDRKENASKYIEGDIIGGEFYDLKNDPQEWNDLYRNKSYQSSISKMRSELLAHLKILKKVKPLTL